MSLFVLSRLYAWHASLDGNMHQGFTFSVDNRSRTATYVVLVTEGSL